MKNKLDMPDVLWCGYEPEILDYNGESYFAENEPLPSIGATHKYHADHIVQRLQAEKAELESIINKIHNSIIGCEINIPMNEYESTTVLIKRQTRIQKHK